MPQLLPSLSPPTILTCWERRQRCQRANQGLGQPSIQASAQDVMCREDQRERQRPMLISYLAHSRTSEMAQTMNISVGKKKPGPQVGNVLSGVRY